MHTIAEGRTFLKSDLWEQWAQLETDQKKKLPPLPIQKPVPESAYLQVERTPISTYHQA